MNRFETQEQAPAAWPASLPNEEGLDSLEAITRSIVDAHGELQAAVAKVRRAEGALARWLQYAEKVLGNGRPEGCAPVPQPERTRELDEEMNLIPAALGRSLQKKTATA